MPKHSSREVLVLFSSLTTCDPGNIFETLELLKQHHIRCSLIGLSAEVAVCKQIAHRTEGTYSIATSETHYKELISAFISPPAMTEPDVERVDLMRMGFPVRLGETGVLSFCMWYSLSLSLINTRY